MSRIIVKTLAVLVLTFLICQLVKSVVEPYAKTTFFCFPAYSQESAANERERQNNEEAGNVITERSGGQTIAVTDEETTKTEVGNVDHLSVPSGEPAIAVEVGRIVFLHSEGEEAFVFHFNVHVSPENIGGTIRLDIFKNLPGPEGKDPIHSIYVDAEVPGSLYVVKETWPVPAALEQGKDKYKVVAVYQKDGLIVRSEPKKFSLWKILKPLADPLPEEAGKPSAPIKVKLKMPSGGPSGVNFYYTLDSTIPDYHSFKYPEDEIEISSFLEPLFAVAEKDGVFSETANYFYSFSYEDCFIATAAFGSPLEPSVLLLRQFRDQYLLTNSPGRLAAGLYYRFSPPLARIIHKNELLKETVRCLLKPVVFLISFLP